MLEHIQLLRNIGQYESVSAGTQISLTKLSLIYAENGRGKTTLASILRSLGTGDAGLILDRHRLGAPNPPHVVLSFTSGVVQFQNGAWPAPMPCIAIFDDAFVAANVCSGVEIDTGHRQNLHELILGAQGVALNVALQGHVVQIEVHNRAVTQKATAADTAVRGAMTVDAFCALAVNPDIDAAIALAERSLAAGQSADAIREKPAFRPLSLPAFDTAAIDALLARTLADLEAEAATRVRTHLRRLGRGGEAWISDGMVRIAGSSEGQGHETCPFCAQDVTGAPLIQHYQAYFSDAYDALKTAITEVGTGINTAHGGEVPAAFERSVRVAVEARTFWNAFAEIPEIDVDTAAILRAWTAARGSVLTVLRAKAGAPLEAIALSPETLALIDVYGRQRAAIDALSFALQACNSPIGIVKERAAAANVAVLTTDLARLVAVRTRHSEGVAELCDDYLNEKAAKAVTEALRTQARAELDNYRRNIFPAYEAAINLYLQRFNAGFRLLAMNPVNTRGGSSCNYNIVINNVAVALTGDAGAAFHNTLSTCDRNTLALAFFFASLEQDPQIADKIVVIDDPMTSLDEHRALTTVLELRRMLSRISQMIVLSHSKPFLCQLWQGADVAQRQAVLIRREGAGSTLMLWDVNQDCITEHDRRHALVAAYMQAGDPTSERRVAAALRHILEAFIRVAYPASFPPGQLLGPFLSVCHQRAGQINQILSPADIEEVRAVLVYANRFHHDTNSAYETESINDLELAQFCGRVLAFAQRP
ncbi:AAA family ATPase [Polymorphobacter sp. PAMC 29334]|uniref:AAA family ATPase n=1 Tax=Polymorphobacter sp. PAMC 29334 TaxID=2862331 RepID=UPI001C754F76|nr:AAA family ATPase [Polymorphobacter sp. PAMC 29334]QYE35237.1 AAA family ATPase [Polymorphobacter sp. PAMC 29334]